MSTSFTASQIKKMTLPLLRAEAAKLFDADDLKGLRKADFQEILIEHFEKNQPTDDLDLDDDDELDDDELDEEEDDTPSDDTEDELADELDDELDEEEPEPEPAPKKAKSKVNDAPEGHKPDLTRVTPPEPTGDTLTAKQVATRIGTDAKTLRKFFRSSASTVEAVGQGGRYEFAKEDMDKIRAEFTAWKSNAKPRAAKGSASKPAASEPTGIVEEEALDLDDEELDPTDEELDDLDLDDDELDD